ncbi:MAG TPA: GTPase domain-containing protein, partial [Gammaproteobacteria bacterium]|nr:GTPase domain-containing protein [Gammaproteobacteria bacterium]
MPVVQKNLLVLGTPSHPGKTNVVEVLSNQNYGYQESLPSTTAVDLGEVNGGKFGDTTFRGKVIDTPSDYKKAGSYFSTADLIAYVVDGTKSFKEQEVELRQLQAYVQEQTMERDPKP